MNRFLCNLLIPFAIIFFLFPITTIHASATVANWMGPNYDYVFNHPLDTTAWGKYFTDESQLTDSLSRINVYKFYLEEIGKNDGNFLSNLIPILKKHNISLATEGSVTGCNPTLVDGTEWANYVLNSLISPLYNAGGVLNYYAVDAFPGGLIARYDQKGCINDISQSLPELIKFMKYFHEVHPETKFGLNINLPNYGYGNTTSYWQENDPMGDYKVHLEKIITAISNAGEKIYFVHVDNPYDYAIGTRPNLYGPKINLDWMKRILDLEAQVKSRGLRFGLIYNSEISGQGFDGKEGNDKQYFDDTLAFIKAYKDRGGNPDDLVIQSWYPHPSELFPDSKPYTFTNLVKKAFPTVIPQGDFNHDSKVNVIDFVLFMNDWLFGLKEGDLNNDGKINAIDYTIFMNDW